MLKVSDVFDLVKCVSSNHAILITEKTTNRSIDYKDRDAYKGYEVKGMMALNYNALLLYI